LEESKGNFEDIHRWRVVLQIQREGKMILEKEWGGGLMKGNSDDEKSF